MITILDQDHPHLNGPQVTTSNNLDREVEGQSMPWSWNRDDLSDLTVSGDRHLQSRGSRSA